MQNLIIVLLGAVAFSCGKGQKNPSEPKYVPFQPADRPADLTTTEHHVQELNKWAKDILSYLYEKDITPFFRKKGLEVPLSQAEFVAKYSVEVDPLSANPALPIEQRCFWQSGVLGATDSMDLYWGSHLQSVRNQIIDAAEFFAKQYKLLRGNLNQPFAVESIRICSYARQGNIFSYDGDEKRLSLGVDEKTIGTSYVIMNDAEIEKMWNVGLGFEKPSSKVAISDNAITSIAVESYKKIKGLNAKIKIWEVLNPIGKYRTTLRSILEGFGVDLVDTLKSIVRSSEDKKSLVNNLRDKLFVQDSEVVAPEMFESQDFRRAIAERLNLTDDQLGGRALEAFLNAESTTRDELVEILGRWAYFVQHRQSSIDTAAMYNLLKERERVSQKVDIDVKMKAFVAVGNVHAININAELFQRSSDSYLRDYVPVEISNELNVKAELTGFVAVWTNDAIQVNARVGNGLVNGGLAAALKGFLGGYDRGLITEF